MSYKRYWVALAIVIIGSFAVLGGVGRKMISEAPPLPDVYTTDGQLLFTGSSITDGQGVWQSIGGQEIGTVWGHGAYVAPDWNADWLHRESEILLNTWAARSGAPTFPLRPDDKFNCTVVLQPESLCGISDRNSSFFPCPRHLQEKLMLLWL